MKLMLCSLLLTGLVILGEPARADYWLVTFPLEAREPKYVERFISLSDCRKRGIANQDLVALFEQKAGFVCIPIEERVEL